MRCWKDALDTRIRFRMTETPRRRYASACVQVAESRPKSQFHHVTNMQSEISLHHFAEHRQRSFLSSPLTTVPTMTDVQAEAGPSQPRPSTTSANPAMTMPIRLTSKTQRHALPDSRFMIPSDWRRYQLSELINKVLAHDQAVPFDFIINGELLRTTLGAFAKAKGLTEVRR